MPFDSQLKRFLSEICCLAECYDVKVSIAWSSMNDGDVYILDVGEILYVWNGKLSCRTERIKVSLQLYLSLII